MQCQMKVRLSERLDLFFFLCFSSFDVIFFVNFVFACCCCFFSLIEASKETRDSKELYGETGITAYE